MSNLRQLIALLPFSALLIAPALSQAQLFSPLAALTSEASNPTQTQPKNRSPP